MRSKFVHRLIIFNILIFSLYAVRSVYLKRQRYAALHQMLAVGKSFAVRSGDTTSEEYDRWVDVADGVQRTRRTSDADFNWIVSVARQNMSDTSLKAINRRGKFIGLLYGIKPWPALQQEKAYQLSIALLATESFSDQNSAVGLFFYTKDRRAIPYLLPLQNSRDTYVRQGVAMALKRLGYNQTAGR